MVTNFEDGQPEERSANNLKNVARKRDRRALSEVARKAKQDLLSDQISFIIVTRDNNKPDPYGPQSSESGPLSWPRVAEKYNEIFRVDQRDIGHAAMEKRARQHREAFLAERPSYPRAIVYTGITPVVKPVGQPKSKLTVLPHGSKATVFNKSDWMIERSSRVSGWIPPDEVRNHDPYGMIERELPVREPAQDETTAIEVYDAFHNHIGDVDISTRDFVNSSALIARQRKEKAGICLHLQAPLKAPSTAAVMLYAACISPTQVRALPEQTSNDTNTTGTRISHEFANLVDLYNVATALEDSHVRSLVLARWQNMLRMDGELELDASMLERLFANTELGDPARMLWTEELLLAGLAEDIIQAGNYPDALVTMLEELLASGRYLLTCG